MAELERLRLADIPEGQRLLREQHGNLLRVADYCQGNYLQASDKRKALQVTMALSAQSLASVTYQVGRVATDLLRLLELQATQLRQLQGDIACVAQRVDIHQEKVSRRGMGALAVPKRLPGGPRVVAPPEPPALEPFRRRALDFSALDGVGHGLRDTSTQLSRTGTLARKGTKCSATPPAGTLGRSSRVPEPVQPPVVPQGKLPRAPSPSLGSPSSSRAPTAPGDGIPVPVSPPGPPPAVPPPPGPPPAVPPPPGPPPPVAMPPPPPLPAHLAVSPAPDDLELLPPPPAVPEFGDLTPPPPPAVPEFGDLTPPPPPAVPEFGDLTPPPPLAVPEFGDLTPPPPLAVPEFGDLTPPPPPAVPEFGDLTPPPPPPAEDPPWAPQNYLEKVVALFPFARRRDAELALEPGALLFVTRRFSDGWCEGVAERGSGIFPGDFVEPV